MDWVIVLVAGWALGHLWPRGWVKAFLAWRAGVEERWAQAGAPAQAPAPAAPAPAAPEEVTGEEVVAILRRMRQTPEDLGVVADTLRAMTVDLVKHAG